MPIWLSVNPHNNIPIYVQIVAQVRHALEVGTLRAGDPLPTVRDLARELTLAPNTIVKAYSELQNLGLIESRPGAGTTVVANFNGALRHGQVVALFERLHTLVHDAAGLGLDQAELVARFESEVARFYSEREG